MKHIWVMTQTEQLILFWTKKTTESTLIGVGRTIENFKKERIFLMKQENTWTSLKVL